MREPKIIEVYNLIELTDDVKGCINACLSDFNTWTNSKSDSGRTLVDMLNDLIKNEGYGLEMSSIQLSSETDGLSDFLEKYKNSNIIVINYNYEYIVLKDKIAAQYIVDWCNEYATHPDIPALLEKIKLKYCIN